MNPSPMPAAAPLTPEPVVGPTLTKGMSFADSKAAFYAVQDYALFHGKQVKVARRGGKHRRMECSSRLPCPFFVQLYLHNSKTNHTWYVSSFELAHSPACDSSAKPTQRQILESATFRRALQSAPNGTARQLLETVTGRANLRTIYRAKETMKRALLDELSASYWKIPALLRVFQELNPGSCTQFEVEPWPTSHSGEDEGGSGDPPGCGAFKRAFVAAGVFTGTTAFNQQIYGLDCVRCSNQEAEYEGVQLFLLGKDGNLANVVVAAACCDAASRDNYKWFFRCVEQAGVNLRYCPVLCAMDPELLSLEGELGLTFRYCTRSIIEKDLTQLGAFSQHHHALVWGLQQSETPDEYANRLEWIATTCGPSVANYLRQLPLQRWAVAGNLGKVSLYGWRSRNFYESVDQEREAARASGSSSGSGGMSAAAEAQPLEQRFRDLLPFSFLESVMVAYMQAAFERNALAAQWKQQSRKVTVRAQELYDAQFRRIGEYKVSRASESVAFVSQLNKSPSLRRRVDLQASTCTCAFIDQFAIPCRHLIAVLLFCNQMESVYGRFAPCYLVDNYALAFRGKAVELPLESSLSDDPTCERAHSSNPSARRRRTEAAPAPPKKKAKPTPTTSETTTSDAQDNAENASTTAPAAPARVRLCKKCRQPGHNMRSCSYQGPPPPAPIAPPNPQ